MAGVGGKTFVPLNVFAIIMQWGRPHEGLLEHNIWQKVTVLDIQLLIAYTTVP